MLHKYHIKASLVTVLTLKLIPGLQNVVLNTSSTFVLLFDYSLTLSFHIISPRVSNLLVEHASVEGNFSALSQTVGEWLDSIKMGRYTELFMEGGYSSLETVTQMTSE